MYKIKIKILPKKKKINTIKNLKTERVSYYFHQNKVITIKGAVKTIPLYILIYFSSHNKRFTSYYPIHILFPKF